MSNDSVASTRTRARSPQAPRKAGGALASRIIAAVMLVAAVALVVFQEMYRSFEVGLAAWAAQLTFTSEAIGSADENGVPAIAFKSGDIWLALQLTLQISGVFAVAAVLLVGAVMLFLPRVRWVPTLVAFVIALALVCVAFVARFVALAGIWSNEGTNAYYDNQLWLTIAVYAVSGVLLVAAALVALLTRKRVAR